MIAFYRDWLSIRDLEVPVIAAVNGHAIGAGLCLALAADLRFAATGAKLGAPFVKLGMSPSGWSRTRSPSFGSATRAARSWALSAAAGPSPAR